MKKSLMILSCLLVFCLCVTGCSPSSSNETVTDYIASDTELIEGTNTSGDIVENADGTHTHADGTVHNADHTDAVENTENSTQESTEIKPGVQNIDELDHSKLKYFAEINVVDYGKIRIGLDYDTAPRTVENFVNLINDGFYNGLTFHRIMDGFMIQGGCPLGNGLGGSAESIIGEFEYNGIKNDISHKRGVISMARAENPNSASSQFFIVHKDSEFLDGQYAAFGYVIEGIEVVDKICAVASPVDDNGTIPSESQPIISSITVIENPVYVAPIEVEDEIEV